MTDKPTINVGELARMLGIGRNQAYELCHQQGFPSFQIGKRILIPVEMLNEWMRGQVREQDAE